MTPDTRLDAPHGIGGVGDFRGQRSHLRLARWVPLLKVESPKHNITTIDGTASYNTPRKSCVPSRTTISPDDVLVTCTDGTSSNLLAVSYLQAQTPDRLEGTEIKQEVPTLHTTRFYDTFSGHCQM